MTKIRLMLQHLLNDALIWAAIIGVGIYHNIYAENLLKFFVLFVCFCTVVAYLARSKTDVLQKLAQGDLKKFKFMRKYSMFSTYIEAFGMATVGLWWTAIGWTIVGIISMMFREEIKEKALDHLAKLDKELADKELDIPEHLRKDNANEKLGNNES